MITIEKSQEEMIGHHVVNVDMHNKRPRFETSSTSSPRKTSKKERKATQNAEYLTDHILKQLNAAGIVHTAGQEIRLYQMMLCNEGLFKFRFLEKCGIAADKSTLRDIYDRVPTIYDGLDNNERESIDFDSDMEALLKRKATGENIFLYFLRMRSRDHKVWYTSYAQVKNHWELGRMMDMLEKTAHDLGFKGFSGMPYHMVIEGKHFDCVPLETGDLPIEWALRAEIPECTCGTVNWEKTGFIGSEWI